MVYGLNHGFGLKGLKIIDLLPFREKYLNCLGGISGFFVGGP